MSRNGLTEAEAGRLGYLASKKTLEQKYAKLVEQYNQNPKLCKQCGKILPYEKRFNSFCSSSCAATFNNIKRMQDPQARYNASIAHGGDGSQFRCRVCGKFLELDQKIFCSEECANEYAHIHSKKRGRFVPPGTCLVCGKPIEKANNTKYCSLECAVRGHWVATRKRIEDTGYFPFYKPTNETNRKVVRRYLEEKYGHRCMICGRDTWNDQPIPLIVDHIDGNAINHKVDNFRLVCPNCDALLDTFKNRGNRTSARTWREKYTKRASQKLHDLHVRSCTCPPKGVQHT